MFLPLKRQLDFSLFPFRFFLLTASAFFTLLPFYLLKFPLYKTSSRTKQDISRFVVCLALCVNMFFIVVHRQAEPTR